MPFLLRISDGFIIVDEKPKQGVFYQLYNKDGFQRPVMIYPSSCLAYSVALDPQDVLHVAVEGTNRQVTYYCFSPTAPSKRVVLEDSRSMYLFENLSIQWLENEPHLFYTVIHPNGLHRSLVHQTLSSTSPTLENLVTSLPLRTSLTYYKINSTLYILYPNFEESYCLNMLSFTNQEKSVTTLVRSPIPIIDWNMCKHQNALYLLYKADQYGHANFYLTNLSTGENLPVQLPDNANNPVLLSYLDTLWIHYESNNHYYTLLVLPENQTFSSPISSSLQNHINAYTYIDSLHEDLDASVIYASLSNTLRLSTIADLDIRNIHPDLVNKDELALFLEGINFKITQSVASVLPPPSSPIDTTLNTSSQVQPNFMNAFSQTPIPFTPEAPITPLNTLPSLSDIMPTSSSTPPSFTATKKDLHSLSEAFMNTGNTFDS